MTERSFILHPRIIDDPDRRTSGDPRLRAGSLAPIYRPSLRSRGRPCLMEPEGRAVGRETAEPVGSDAIQAADGKPCRQDYKVKQMCGPVRVATIDEGSATFRIR
jgi:hypothetical protein